MYWIWPGAHVQAIVRKFYASLWLLRHLKSAGVPNMDLLSIYQSMIRPVIEYASPAFHPMLTAAQAGTIEQLQAYKFMFGWNVSYKTALEHTSTERAEDRRTTLVQNFALKSSKNDRFKR